jgi:hypothetical protein
MRITAFLHRGIAAVVVSSVGLIGVSALRLTGFSPVPTTILEPPGRHDTAEEMRAGYER